MNKKLFLLLLVFQTMYYVQGQSTTLRSLQKKSVSVDLKNLISLEKNQKLDKADFAGCLTSENGQYPDETFVPVCNGLNTTVGGIFAASSEYSLVELKGGNNYNFHSTLATDYITIGNEDGTTVLATGQSTVAYTPVADITIRFYTHGDTTCSADNRYRSRVISCGVSTVDPPANDLCSSAFPIICGETAAGSTVYATNSGGNLSSDLFYKYTGNGIPQYVKVSLCESDFDTFLRVYSDCSLNTLVASNDDGTECGTRSQLTFQSDGTSTYYIMVEGLDALTGNYTIDVKCEDVPPPPSGCSGFSVESNNFENGALFSFRPTIDIPVGNEGFTIYGIEPTIIQMTGQVEPSFFQFKIYNDNNGFPGEVIESRNGQIKSKSLKGNNFGLDFMKYTVNFDTPISFAPNRTYWAEMVSDGVAWENTTKSSSIIGSPVAAFVNGAWQIQDYEVVFNFMCESLNVKEVSNKAKLFPNPVKDLLYINSSEKIKNISFYNIAGQKIKDESVSKADVIDLSHLKSGVYILNINYENGTVQTEKIIKK